MFPEKSVRVMDRGEKHKELKCHVIANYINVSEKIFGRCMCQTNMSPGCLMQSKVSDRKT